MNSRLAGFQPRSPPAQTHIRQEVWRTVGFLSLGKVVADILVCPTEILHPLLRPI